MSDKTPLPSIDHRIIDKVSSKRQSAAERFPLVFALGATFGVVSIFYGFEKLIDRVPLFVHHPWILLIVGLSILIVTGSLYKKLD